MLSSTGPWLIYAKSDGVYAVNAYGGAPLLIRQTPLTSFAAVTFDIPSGFSSANPFLALRADSPDGHGWQLEVWRLPERELIFTTPLLSQENFPPELSMSDISPDLVQGMGGYISGLVESDPITEVIEGIRQMEGHVLFPQNAKIDQIEGAAYAAAAGYKRFAVTVADAKDAEKLRELEKTADVHIMIIGVHLTGITSEEASRLLAAADIVTACASKHIREQVRPLVQVGTAVPLFGLTRWGKDLLVERAKEVEQPLLINTMPLPVLPERKQPRPLV